MTLIEGIGDEVVEFFIALLIVVIGVVAWWSTRIADHRPLIRTVLVFERRSQSHTNQISTQSTNEERRNEQQNQRDYIQDLSISVQQGAEEEPEPEGSKPPEAGTSVKVDRGRTGRGSGDPTENPDQAASSVAEEEQREIVESMDSEEACVLRRRRLEFFQNLNDASQGTTTTANNDLNNEVNNSTIIITSNEHVETAETNLNNQEDVDNASRTDTTNIADGNIEDDIRIKLKYINDDLKLVNGKLQEPLGNFKRRHFELELANDKLVRLIFNGKVLQRDDLTLENCGLFDNCVVHCLVHQKKTNSNDHTTTNGSNLGSGTSTPGSTSSTDRPRMTSNTQNQGREWDLGNLFFAIVSFVLGAAWYFRYEYAQLYTVTATVALVGLTGIFTILLVGMYFPDPEPSVQPVRS